jgi:hypothetical protein
MSAFVAIASQTTNTTTASVTFSGISADYRDLMVVIDGLTTTNGVTALMRFNSSTSGYDTVFMESNGSSSVAGAWSTSGASAFYNYALYNSGSRTITRFDILDASATNRFKTVLSRSGNGFSGIAGATSMWNTTARITSVTLLPNTGSWAANSTFAIYGIKA